MGGGLRGNDKSFSYLIVVVVDQENLIWPINFVFVLCGIFKLLRRFLDSEVRWNKKSARTWKVFYISGIF